MLGMSEKNIFHIKKKIVIETNESTNLLLI